MMRPVAGGMKCFKRTQKLRKSENLQAAVEGEKMQKRKLASCSITLRRLAPPKLFDYKERDFHRSNSPIDQTLDKRKSFTVDEANVFQVKSELDSFLQCQLGGLA